MGRVKEAFRQLSKPQKVQVLIASTVTTALIIAVPVYAWFTLSQKAETLTKVQEPKNLDIRAGDAEAVQYFDLNDISIEDITPENPKRYVFCVVTDSAKTYYDLQIAHTTNIPFTYTLYRAEVGDSTDANTVAYTTHSANPQTIYYKRKGDPIELQSLNPDTAYAGRTLGKKGDVYYGLVYGEDDDGNKDDPEIYAIARYEQKKELETWDPEHDFYILELGIDTSTYVDGFEKWNTANNNKETDIIYITASRTIK